MQLVFGVLLKDRVMLSLHSQRQNEHILRSMGWTLGFSWWCSWQYLSNCILEVLRTPINDRFHPRVRVYRVSVFDPILWYQTSDA